MDTKLKKATVLAGLLAIGLTLVGCDDSDDGGTLGGGSGGSPSITISVSGGTTPQYTWSDGDVFSLSVVRTSDPTTIVWGLATPGSDGVVSGATHGTTPTGVVPTVLPGDEEPTLTPGVEYRVSASRTDSTFGFTDFTP